MKIRTDFVTNSSSSSFIFVQINLEDGRTVGLGEDGCAELSTGSGTCTSYEHLNIKEGKLFHNNNEITDKAELIAALIEEIESWSCEYEFGSMLLKYLAGEISPRQLIETMSESEIEYYTSTNAGINDDEIIGTIKAEIEDEGIDLAGYVDVYESISSLENISSIEYHEGFNTYGSELPYIEFPSQSEIEEKAGLAFPCYSDEEQGANPEKYSEDYSTWEDIIWDSIKINEYEGDSLRNCEVGADLDLEDAIRSGDYYLAIEKFENPCNYDYVWYETETRLDFDQLSIKQTGNDLNGNQQLNSLRAIKLIDESSVVVTTGLSLTDEAWVKEQVEARGGAFKEGFVKKITCLVINPNYDHETTKLKKTKELIAEGKDVKIISFDEFKGLL